MGGGDGTKRLRPSEHSAVASRCMGKVRKRKTEARLSSREPFIFPPRNVYGSQCHRRGADNEKQTLALRRPDRRSRERIQIFDETDGGRLEDRLRSDAS